MSIYLNLYFFVNYKNSLQTIQVLLSDIKVPLHPNKIKGLNSLYYKLQPKISITLIFKFYY